MPRRSAPWYRKGADAWYVKIAGKQIPLAKGKAAKEEAWAKYHALMVAPKDKRKPGDSLRTGEVCDLYVSHATANLAPLTAEFYKRHLESFARHAGRVSVDDLAPKHVTAWLGKHPGWGPSTRSQAITAVKRAFRWAKREGHVPANPVADVEKPGVRSRLTIMSREQGETIRGAVAAGDPFGDLLDVLRDTGARPSEAMAVEARHFDRAERTLTLSSKTTARTGKKRTIHLTDRIAGRLAELAAAHPTGPLLRNSDGEPWTRNATACRFARLRKRLGMGPEATAESYRHMFATDLLEAGVPIATVAELMGHTSTAMISRHYSHLRNRHDHMREALGKARGGESS